MFETLWSHPLAKYAGSLGLDIPFVVGCYYIFVSSWCLAYAFFSISGSYFGLGSLAEVGHFLAGYQGVEQNRHFASFAPAYVFFLIAFGINVAICSAASREGIERLALWAMPLLFVFAAALMIRVLTLDPPAGAAADQTVSNGLGFVGNPDFPRSRIHRSGWPRPGRSSSRSRWAGESCTPTRPTSGRTTTSR